MSNNEKTDMPYRINGIPVTWGKLIAEAQKVGRFRDPQFKTSSEAASILRDDGHTVDVNPENEQ